MSGPTWVDLFVGSFRLTIEFTAILLGVLCATAIVVGNIYLAVQAVRVTIALVWPKSPEPRP